MLTSENEFTAPVLKATIADAYDRLIAPAIEREIRSSLTEKQKMAQLKYSAKLRTAFITAADCRKSRTRLGPGIPYRL